ncbi:MAG: ATP-binding protein, partial [Phycisphaerales bacterium]|nr:ATP-binding protein [Phycisphaerales bacterium]
TWWPGCWPAVWAYDTGPCLLVDVGTNGEILLKHGDRVLGCATAAGPAFEGAGLSSGIRAGRGAISQISFNLNPFEIVTKVIGEDRPIGLCGSAYIDFLSEARAAGLLNPFGRFEPHDVPGASEHFKSHDDHASAMVVARGRGGQALLVTETDIATLLQAKAAIAAGIETLLEQAQVKAAEITTVYLAGGFGTHMDHRHAIACGLLPGFVAEQVKVVGNSSLAGAFLALLDQGAMEEMKKLAMQVEVLELNLVPGFEDRYIDHLQLP